MNKTYLYVRYSTAEQRRGRSEARQLAKAREYCDRHGLMLVEGEEGIFVDRGLSAYKGEHMQEGGALRRFTDLVRAGAIEKGSYLLVESLDRMSRQDMHTASDQLRALTSRGVIVVTLADEQKYTGDANDLIGMIASMLYMSRSHEESRMKAQRIRDAWSAKQAKARDELVPISAACPLWLSLKDGRYEVQAERAAVVRRIFQETIDGRGKAVVAKRLNEEGVPSFKGTSWGTSSVEKVLRNRAVFGELQLWTVQGAADEETVDRRRNGDAVPNYFPVVVDEATFHRAQHAIDTRRKLKVTKQGNVFNVYSKVGVCGYCKATLNSVNKGNGKGGGRYLQCSGARKGLCERSRSIKMDKAEQAFMEVLAGVGAMSLIEGKTAEMERKLEELTGKRDEQQRAYEKHRANVARFPDEDGFAQLMAEAGVEVRRLSAEVEALRQAIGGEVVTTKEDFFAALDLESYEGRNRANALLKRLQVTIELRGADMKVKKERRSIFGLAYVKETDEWLTIPYTQEQAIQAQEWQTADNPLNRMNDLMALIAEATMAVNGAPLTQEQVQEIFGKLAQGRGI